MSKGVHGNFQFPALEGHDSLGIYEDREGLWGRRMHSLRVKAHVHARMQTQKLVVPNFPM